MWPSVSILLFSYVVVNRAGQLASVQLTEIKTKDMVTYPSPPPLPLETGRGSRENAVVTSRQQRLGAGRGDPGDPTAAIRG